MIGRSLTVALRVALAVALMASAALFVDYRAGGASFCGGASGCAEVRQSALARVGPVDLPSLGLLALALLYAASLFASRPRHLRLVAVLSCVGGTAGLGLIATQLFVIRAVCPWCMAVDCAAVVAAVLAVVRARREPDPEPRWLRGVWAAAGVAAIASPLAFGDAPPRLGSDLPAPIALEQRPGATNIVMFTDFQCPWCRRLHQAMHERVAVEPAKFRLVRKMVPLPGHDGAEPAARAYLCTPEPAREKMATRLYQAEVEAMSREGLVALARELGLAEAEFSRCYDAEATTAAIASDKATFMALDLEGLPSTFVDDKIVRGANLPALEKAIDGVDLRAMFALVFGAQLIAALAALVEARRAGKLRSGPGASPTP